MNEQRFKHDLKKLDQLEPKNKPSQIEMMLTIQATRKRQRNELIFFFVVAFIVVASTVLLMVKAPVWFILLQAVVMVLALVGFLSRRKVYSRAL